MRLSEFKTLKKLTDSELADLIGDCTTSAVVKWGRSERVPSKEVMERIALKTEGLVMPNDFYDVQSFAEGEAIL